MGESQARNPVGSVQRKYKIILPICPCCSKHTGFAPSSKQDFIAINPDIPHPITAIFFFSRSILKLGSYQTFCRNEKCICTEPDLENAYHNIACP